MPADTKQTCADRCNLSEGQGCTAYDHLRGAPACENDACVHCSGVYEGSQGTFDDGTRSGSAATAGARDSTIDCDGNCP